MYLITRISSGCLLCVYGYVMCLRGVKLEHWRHILQNGRKKRKWICQTAFPRTETSFACLMSTALWLYRDRWEIGTHILINERRTNVLRHAPKPSFKPNSAASCRGGVSLFDLKTMFLYAHILRGFFYLNGVCIVVWAMIVPINM